MSIFGNLLNIEHTHVLRKLMYLELFFFYYEK